MIDDDDDEALVQEIEEGWLDTRKPESNAFSGFSYNGSLSYTIPRKQGVMSRSLSPSQESRVTNLSLSDTPDEKPRWSKSIVKEKLSLREAQKLKERELRRARRGQQKSTQRLSKPKQVIVDSEEEFVSNESNESSESSQSGSSDEEEASSGSEEQSDLTPRKSVKDMKTKTPNVITIDEEDPEDRGDYDEQEGVKTELVHRSQRILMRCKQVSNDLRSALLQWSTTSSEDEALSDCVNLTSLTKKDSSLLREHHIQQMCPALELKVTVNFVLSFRLTA